MSALYSLWSGDTSGIEALGVGIIVRWSERADISEFKFNRRAERDIGHIEDKHTQSCLIFELLVFHGSRCPQHRFVAPSMLSLNQEI